MLQYSGEPNTQDNATSGLTVSNQKLKGGGVALLINSKIPFKIRDDLSCTLIECLWVAVRPKWLPREISRISVCCVCLPPGQSEMEVKLLISVLRQILFRKPKFGFRHCKRL